MDALRALRWHTKRDSPLISILGCKLDGATQRSRDWTAVETSVGIMASSFVGRLVQITLNFGGSTVVGTIVNVDPVTQTLSIRETHSGQVVELTRDRIGGLQLIEQPPITSASTSVAHQHRPQQPSQPMPDIGQLRVAASPSRQPRQQQQGNAPSVPKSKAKPNGAEIRDAPARSYGEDFDFEANLNQFDKKKIWQEIRVRLAFDCSD